MTDIATTRLSSRGQVVIPEEIRGRLALTAGTRFVVVGEGDTIVLKAIQPPRFDEFEKIVATARRQAREAGLTREDVAGAIRRARSRR